MSEAETWELLFTTADASLSAFAVFLSITFAYLITAYIVGKGLTRAQALSVSFLYIFSSGVSASAAVGSIRRATFFSGKLREIYPDETFVVSSFLTYSIALLILVVIFLSLIFMYQIRRRG